MDNLLNFDPVVPCETREKIAESDTFSPADVFTAIVAAYGRG